MAKSKNWTTAAEFIAEMQADPERVRAVAEHKARHAARVAQLKAEMEPEHVPLLRDLAAAGLHVNSASDLLNMNVPYPNAVPVLLRHLATAQHPVMREILARALTAQEAEGVAGGPILRELKREQAPQTRFAMANALTIVAAPGDADEIAALLADPAYKDVHDRLGQALKNLRPTKRRRPGPKPRI